MAINMIITAAILMNTAVDPLISRQDKSAYT